MPMPRIRHQELGLLAAVTVTVLAFGVIIAERSPQLG